MPSPQSRHVGVKENLNRAKFRIASLEKQIKAAAIRKLDSDNELRMALNALTSTSNRSPGVLISPTEKGSSQKGRACVACQANLAGSVSFTCLSCCKLIARKHKQCWN